MIKLALLKPEYCYGPEIYALSDYLSKKYSDKIYCQILEFDEIKKKQNDFDLIYRLMGFSSFILEDFKIPEIHDYASISTGRYISFKNFIKRNFQKKPLYRSFLNSNVFDEFNFKDNIPYGFRDMAVKETFFKSYDFNYDQKEFDFCYIGEISKERNSDELIDFFGKSNFKVLMIGENKLGENKYKNIIFSGRVENSIVPNLINKCRFAINFVPNLYPYNLQTSTKLLEYLSMGIPVISNKYKWVEDYVENNNISLIFFDDFSFFENDFYSFYKKYENYNNVPKVKKWEDVFESSGLIDFILNYNGK